MSSHYSLSNTIQLDQQIIAMRVNLIPIHFFQAVQVIRMSEQSTLVAHESVMLSAEVLHIAVFMIVTQDQEGLSVLKCMC